MSEIKDDETLEDHLQPSRGPSTDPDYLAFKEAKIKLGLKQSTNRSELIPAHEVWEQLGLER